MRTFLAVAAGVIVLGGWFMTQRKNIPPAAATVPHTEESRPVSEHDWAKHALETTAKVRRDVQRQRADDAP